MEEKQQKKKERGMKKLLEKKTMQDLRKGSKKGRG